MLRFNLIMRLMLLILLFGVQVSWAAVIPLPESLAEDTMLMFVGESSPVVTVASRMPEAPTTAPAIVTVVGREEIDQKGYRTLADLLAAQPGFHVAAGGRGSAPYLRGLRDSVLFLYDGVPLTTDVTKSFAPLDNEISLDAIDRVEIVRGPGSILWGPDAFAGVVNLVPATGKQKTGAMVELSGGSDDRLGGFMEIGKANRHWEGYLGVNMAHETFYDPDFVDWDENDQTFSSQISGSDFTEIVGTLNYEQWLHISARWSDFARNYTLRNADESIVWSGEKQTPVNQLKVSASKISGASHYTLTGYYQETDYQVIDSDIERAQRNRVLHAELLWDRRVLSRGMLTLGGSWRKNAVDGALVRDGFLPDFLPPDAPIFVPNVSQSDFSNRLYSAFGQFRYRLTEGEWWLGLRLDDHNQYDSTLSYSFGYHWPVSDSLHAKLSYGTAFRSPYSSQLFDETDFDPESIRTGTAQLTWQPGNGGLLEVTLFHSNIDDHRAEDPYGGLSQPASRELYGIEVAGEYPVSKALTLSGNLSVINGTEPDDLWVDEICFVRPDGSTTCLLEEWTQPAEQGPDWLANLGVHWQVAPGQSLNVGARFGGSYDYGYQKGEIVGRYSMPVLVDLNYQRPGFFSGRDRISFKVTNLLDEDYLQDDIYGPVAGPPLQMQLDWQYRF